jgi:quinol monooxygenase YgiN
MEEIALIVHYQALPGQGDEVAGLLAQHTAATRAEPGCRAFKAHQASPHFEGIAVARIRPLLAERRLEYRQVIEPRAS